MTASRSAFEAWVKSHEDYRTGDLAVEDWDNQPYVNGDMQTDWEIWQAARASVVIEIPDTVGSRVDFVNAVIAAIHSAGCVVKV